jgi:hypothetical protein
MIADFLGIRPFVARAHDDADRFHAGVKHFFDDDT